MNSYRKTAIIVGVLFIACTGATILSLSLTDAILDGQDYLIKLTENKTIVITGALIEFIWAITGAGIAIGLYPILKKYNGALALGSVGFRIVENVFVLIGTLSLLSLLTLSQEFAGAGAQDAVSVQTAGTLLMAVRDWAHNVIVIIAFSMGALLYYYILYQSKLIPRWLSGWGFLGAVLTLAVTLYSSFNPDYVVSWTHTLLNAPIALQEMVFAVWLIAKGFNLSAIASLPAK